MPPERPGQHMSVLVLMIGLVLLRGWARRTAIERQLRVWGYDVKPYTLERCLQRAAKKPAGSVQWILAKRVDVSGLAVRKHRRVAWMYQLSPEGKIAIDRIFQVLRAADNDSPYHDLNHLAELMDGQGWKSLARQLRKKALHGHRSEEGK